LNMNKFIHYSFVALILFNGACTSMSKQEIDEMTVKSLEIKRFMGNWYVLAGRFTFLEKEVYNSLEVYVWNEQKQRIDIGFTYNKGGFDGKVKSIPQTGWIFNHKTNAYWKVSPIWPIKADYLVIALADDYSWTAIGVPNQKYLWIMARDFKDGKNTIEKAVQALNEKGYDASNLIEVPHNYDSKD